MARRESAAVASAVAVVRVARRRAAVRVDPVVPAIKSRKWPAGRQRSAGARRQRRKWRTGSKPYSDGYGGGGGGGGYYGGGGGGGTASFEYSEYRQAVSGGGGGGSSYVEPSAITSRMWTGWQVLSDGRVSFSW